MKTIETPIVKVIQFYELDVISTSGGNVVDSPDETTDGWGAKTVAAPNNEAW